MSTTVLFPFFSDFKTQLLMIIIPIAIILFFLIIIIYDLKTMNKELEVKK